MLELYTLTLAEALPAMLLFFWAAYSMLRTERPYLRKWKIIVPTFVIAWVVVGFIATVFFDVSSRILFPIAFITSLATVFAAGAVLCPQAS